MIKHQRPRISGRAAFKTLLKRSGFKVPRDFYGCGCCIAVYQGRFWRFRFFEGLVDVSCPKHGFDRWANSLDKTMSIEELKVILSAQPKGGTPT